MKNFKNLQNQTLTNVELAAVKGGHRRQELDHVGAYNFTVEIEGINAGYFKTESEANTEGESEVTKG
ncbi:hypothetical protein BKI52_00415 [marine bacterium AO1-C]|nr:hypothetical protein BKI52_00415 [marine bacterium AO1-C]